MIPGDAPDDAPAGGNGDARASAAAAPPGAGIGDLVRDRSIVVCCGSGGVGKTTTAAVVALEGARLGRKTVVVTIDPAKRLADALGLAGLTDTPSRIDGLRRVARARSTR